MPSKPDSTIGAGQFAGYDPDNPKLVCLVVETTTVTKDDGSEQSMALVAKLPLEHVPTESLFKYGTDPTPPEAQVTETTSDVASGIQG